MSLLAPGWLFLAALAILVLVLHMRRRRQLDVPSVMLWRLVETAAAPHRSPRWPPPSVLLAIQLLIVFLVALALAQPLLGGNRADIDHTIYVLDASASMRATDAAPSRFDAALTWLTDRVGVGAFDAETRVSVLTVGPTPRIEVARQAASSGILPLIEGLRATDGTADWDGAAILAGQLMRAGETSAIVILTDGTDTAAAGRFVDAFASATVDAFASATVDAFASATVEQAIFAGADATNIGLTAHVVAVDAATGQWRIEGALRFSGIEPATAAVEILYQPHGTDGFVHWAEITVPRIAANAPPVAEGAPPAVVVDAPLHYELQLPGPGAILVRLPDDTGLFDNEARFVLRAAPVTASVLYLGTPTLPLVAALQAVGNLEIVTATEVPADLRTFDLVIVDGVILPERPATNVLWLGTGRAVGDGEPTVLVDPFTTGWDADHPLSSQVDWSAVQPRIAYLVSRLAGATVLAETGGAPLVQARTTPNGREVVLAFDLASSAWPNQSGFPVFVNNLVAWLGIDLGAVSIPPCAVGSPCPIEARLLAGRVVAADGTVVWSVRSEGAEFLLQGVERSFIPDRAGFYRLEAGGETRLLAVNAVTAGETVLAPQAGTTQTQRDAGTPPRAWWWLLLLALVLLVIEASIAGTGVEQFLKRAALARTNPLFLRRRLQLGFRIGAVTLAVAAIAGLPVLGREPAEDVVVVMGTELGGETPNPDRDRLLREVENNRADAGAGARGGLVATGDGTRIAADIGGNAGQIDAAGLNPATPGTNLEAAMLMAAAMLPGDRTGRIVLATDGNETEGEIARAIAALQARGLVVDIQPVTELPPGEVLVESVNAPPRVYAGDAFTFSAVIYAQAATTATVTIRRAGEIILDQTIDLLAGRNVVDGTVPAGDAGTLLIEVAVAAGSDTYPQNNHNGVIVAVAPTPSIIVVTPQPALGEYFAQALTVQGLTSRIVVPADAPDTIDGWLAYDTVVLMNVPAIDLDTAQQEQLEEFVQVHGRGVLLLGGENTFGPGGYFQTPFERMSPLSSRVPHELPLVAIVYVLDRSGSMSAAVGDVTRLDIAKSAAMNAVSLLSPDSRVGIVLFDSSSIILVPLGPRNDAAIAAALAPVIPGGGTNIFPGLQDALNMLSAVDASAKHVVVMTDGITAPADFDPLLQFARQQGITVSTIAIGNGIDPRRLQEIAALGRGAFHMTEDFRALPAILAQETLMLVGPPVRERVAEVVWLNRDAPFLAGLPDRLPPIYSYVVTTAKQQADVHLGVIDEDGEVLPLMATWRYGNGKVLALATHGAGAGTAEWIQLPEYPLMWSQVIRAFLPDTEGPGLHVALDRNGDEVRVTADFLDPAGAPVAGRSLAATITDAGAATVALEETGPGRYQGAFAVGELGVYHVEVAADDKTATAEMYVAYPARYNFGRADFDKLSALAAATGGELLLGDEPVLSGARQWVALPGWRLWALIGLMLFVVDLTIRHAPNVFGLRRRARPVGPALAVPA